MSSPKGRYVNIDFWKPRAVAICDRSGFVCMHKDLVKQMEWSGESLVWTGLWVNKVFQDIPNEQARTPYYPPDPVPVDHPRPEFIQLMTPTNNPLPPPSQLYYTPANLSTVVSGAMAPSSASERLENLLTVNWGTA